MFESFLHRNKLVTHIWLETGTFKLNDIFNLYETSGSGITPKKSNMWQIGNETNTLMIDE